MPRAYCPECASEVPVDADGLCHLGHRVELGGASVGGGTVDAAGDAGDADEPQPWVASVDPTTSGGFTPPPADTPTATPDVGGAWTPDDGPDIDVGPTIDTAGGDELAAAAADAVESLEADADAAVGPDPVEATGEQVEAGWPGTLPAEGDTPGWTPPTNDPVAPPPVPAPAPVDPPAPAPERDDLAGDDFDLDDLAAAVSDLDMDDDSPPAAPPATGHGSADEVAAPSGAGASDLDDVWEDELGEPADEPPVEVSSSEPDESVDLSNFTAKSGRVRTDKAGKKGGRLRRR